MGGSVNANCGAAGNPVHGKIRSKRFGQDVRRLPRLGPYRL